jgi:hypothetical protein
MKTFAKHYKGILQIITLVLFFTIFSIGGFNLFTLDVNVLPVQILILLLNYPVTIFCLKFTNIENLVTEYKKQNGME